MKYIGLAFCFLIVFLGCSEKYDHVSEDQFVGIWELEGRKVFDGIQVEITKENNKFKGKITKLNNNKYVNLFAEVSDVWVSEIDRSSRYQFRLTEKKIGRELFSLYGLSSSTEFSVEFIDKNTIGLSGGGADPTESTVVYKRIK
ncbi:hypothetical protein JMN32_26090 [Fulvivirga sp. 29W222]|uniref:Uncharacterized protein n=1 Tax=Fulvivirga marina TaxID=2494733 RepID=A0A937KEP8_9BACT|nr:hypothetical protein [Fulvivirga marina]MBL6449809.1 hypothetical protein [Fulvivirga marina]